MVVVLVTCDAGLSFAVALVGAAADVITTLATTASPPTSAAAAGAEVVDVVTGSFGQLTGVFTLGAFVGIPGLLLWGTDRGVGQHLQGYSQISTWENAGTCPASRNKARRAIKKSRYAVVFPTIYRRS
jgi:hypothetical protein